MHFRRDSQGSWIVLRHLLTVPDKTVCLLSDISLDLKLLLVTRHVLRTIRPYLATWEFSFSSSTFCIGIVSF